MRRHEDHVRGWIELHDPLQHFEPAQSRHYQIGKHNLRMVAVSQIEPLLGIGGREDFKTRLRQRGRQQIQARCIVVDDQKRERGLSSSGHLELFTATDAPPRSAAPRAGLVW